MIPHTPVVQLLGEAIIMDDLNEITESIRRNHVSDSDGYVELDSDEATRIAEEILGDVEVWTASKSGPDGPWFVGSLTIRRDHNVIVVYDVDNVMVERFPVTAVTGTAKGPVQTLLDRLKTVQEEALRRL